MPPTSSSPSNPAVEFGLLPRTPASNWNKNGRTPTGKENSGSGSLHKRLFNSLRSRSRSFTRTSDAGSPSAKPIKRRKSIVDLLNFGSSSSQDSQGYSTPGDTRKTEDNASKEDFARESLFLFRDEHGIPPVEVQFTEDTRDTSKNVRDSKKFSAKCETEDEEGKSDSSQPRLAGENADGMLLLEAGLARILDDINIDVPAAIVIAQRRASSFQQLLDEANNRTKHARTVSMSDSLFPLFGDSRSETREDSRRGTPDSYLQLLIESCETPQAQSASTEAIIRQPVGRKSVDQEKQQSSPNDFDPMSTTAIGYCPGPSVVQNSRLCTPDSFLQRAEVIEPNDGDISQFFLEPLACQSTNEQDMDFDLDTGLLIGYQYELRDSTPKVLEAAEREPHDRRPTVTVHEFIPTPSLVDLDPKFSQRHEEISQRYSNLNLEPGAEWASNSERISQGFNKTKAEKIIGSVQEFVHNRFVEDEEEVWESIKEGMELLIENKRNGRGNLSSETLISDPVGTIGEEHGYQEASISPIDLIFSATSTEKKFPLESVDSGPEFMDDTCENAAILREFPSEDLFLPLIDQVLEESIVMRTPLDPFYAMRRATGMDIGYLGTFTDTEEAGEQQIPRWSYSFEAEFPPTDIFSEVPATQELRPSSRSRRHISSAAVQVQFPSTLNLLQHTETYVSKVEAIAAVQQYKLGELSNFCIYDAEKRKIIAHSIDSPVPNPADLARMGLEILWLATHDGKSDENQPNEGSAFEGYLNRSGKVSGMGSGFDDSGLPQWGNDSQASITERYDNNEAENSFSVHRPDTKRYTSSLIGISAENPFADNGFPTLVSETRRQCCEDQSRVEMPGEDTWKNWKAVSPRTKLPVATSLGKVLYQRRSAFKINDERLLDSERSCSQDDQPRERLSDSSSTHENEEHIEFVSGNRAIEDESLFDAIMLAARSSDVNIAGEPGNSTEILSPRLHTPDGLPMVIVSANVSDNKLDTVSTAVEERKASSGSEVSQDSRGCVEHPSGYHFTAMKHLMATSECSRKTSAATQSSSDEIMEALFDAIERVSGDIGIHNDAVDTKPFKKIRGNLARRGIEFRMEDIEAIAAHNSPKSHDNYDIEPVNLQEEKEDTTTLEDMDLQLVGKAARNATPIRKQRSKVGALVDIFQAHGIMPRTPLRTTASSVSPSFNRQQDDRNGENSLGMRTVSGNARKISGKFSASPHSISSSNPGVTTPGSPLDRREYRTSNIDRKESYTYGEVLRKVDKREFSRNDERWTNDSEMYG
ncbi:hypothetical protein JHW43_003187 [Diplocarpon mali]|nr:hypothetical protein JHW43_003187 [Diplocarpon mali]